jgi:hypothetical protein
VELPQLKLCFLTHIALQFCSNFVLHCPLIDATAITLAKADC